jgi:hypothetical protein
MKLNQPQVISIATTASKPKGGKALSKKLQQIFHTNQSVSQTLDDIQMLLSLSNEEFLTALSLLEKADFGSLSFTRNNTDIRFQSSASVVSQFNQITVEVTVKESEVKRTIEFEVPKAVLRVLRRAKKRKTAGLVKEGC